MNLILHWVVNAVALLVVGALFKHIRVKGFGSALVGVLVIGVVNVFLGPVLHLLALPVTFLTLGLFALAVNAVLFWIAGSVLSGFAVEGCFAAFFGSLAYSILTTLAERLVFAPVPA